MAHQLGLSKATVCLVLKGRYPARTHRVAARVRELLPAPPPIACPVLGELKPEACLFHQARPFAATNPQRIALWRACRNGCPHANPRIQP